MTFRDSIVDSLAIICTVRRHRRGIRIDLIEQVREFGDIADIIRPQFVAGDRLANDMNVIKLRTLTTGWRWPAARISALSSPVGFCHPSRQDDLAGQTSVGL
jgi:hypothetical protein